MKTVWTVALLGVLLAVVPGMAQSAGDPSINAILNAPTASAAISAYARATRLGSDALAAEKAFVSKMADLGQPKLAFEQAIDLAEQDPAQGLAWAVAAYNYADRNEPVNAFTDLLVAVRHEPNEPFVIRTAGQLLAWFDSDKVDRDALSDPLRTDVGVIKIRYGDNDLFRAAYDQAAMMYGGVTPPDQTPATPPVPAVAPPAPTYPYPGLTDYGYDYTQPYFPDYYPDLYAYDQPWWWNPYWGGDGFAFFGGGYGHRHGGRDGDRGVAGGRYSGGFSSGSLAAPPGGSVGGIAGSFRTGRNTSTFGTTATPPGVGGGGFRSLTTSGGFSPRFSVWHSSNPGGNTWSTRGTVNRSTGFSGSTGNWRGSFSPRVSRGFSISHGTRSFSGGFRSSGGFRGGGGGFHGGGGHR